MGEKSENILLYSLMVIAIISGCFLVSQTDAFKHTFGSNSKIGFVSEPIDYTPLIKWLEEEKEEKIIYHQKYILMNTRKGRRRAGFMKKHAEYFQRSIDSLKMGIRPKKVTPYNHDPLWIRMKY